MSATREKTSNSYLFANPTPEITEMHAALVELISETPDKSYGEKFNEVIDNQSLHTKDTVYQDRMALALATLMQRCTEVDYNIRYKLSDLLSGLLRGRLGLVEADYLRMFKLYGLDFATDVPPSHDFWPFPVNLTLVQVARLAKKQGQLQEPMLTFLRQLFDYTSGQTGDNGRVASKALKILNQANRVQSESAVLFANDDPFGQLLNEFVSKLELTAPGTSSWVRLLQLLQKANGAQPTAKFQREVAAAVAAIGAEAVATHYELWLSALAKLPVQELSRTNNYGGQSYTYSEWHFLSQTNQDAVKGLLWTSVPLLNAAMLHFISELTTKCYRKIPGKGQLAPSLGNAGVWALAQSGLPGVAHLSRLHGAVKQPNTQSLIGRYIEKASLELGMTPAELEDMAVPDFGLVDGRAEYAFGDYQAVLTLAGNKVEVQWSKAGKPLKSAPAALKSTHAAELRNLKLTQTQVQQTYTAQRDRLDRSYIMGRCIAWPRFRRYYLEHGIVGELAGPLIWRIHHANGSHHDALWQNDTWRNAKGEALPGPADTDTVQLWHPVLATTDEVLAWRSLLDAQELRQPFKQAYREVYLLTPPEERTRVYSNRMAAHVLRQHQFSALARGRGWNYRLMGAYDKGYESDSTTLELPAHGLQAQFWVSEVNADDAYNDTGIWNYVSTDQVRFVTGHGPVPLPEVPPLVFSEVMRDVDLFVGVASVGNDPLWRDNGGLVQYRNYWENYSFGELGEVAKTRKMALERLVPRLKFGKVSEIKGNFLEVKGKLRTYKIHLGSGNILMTPNDQYLCIVPDRSAKTAGTAGVFLPFEGDAVLSIILSKALLLMDDDKITDDTIVRQIKQR